MGYFATNTWCIKLSVLLRDATPADFDAIARISVAAYQEYADLLTAEDWQKMHYSLSNVPQTAIQQLAMSNPKGYRFAYEQLSIAYCSLFTVQCSLIKRDRELSSMLGLRYWLYLLPLG